MTSFSRQAIWSKNGRVPRRHVLASLLAAGVWPSRAGLAQAARQPGDPPPIAVRTLNHVNLIGPNVQRTRDWYLKLTDMKRLENQEPERGPRTSGYEAPPISILRVGSGPQFVALVQGTGPAAFRPHVGLGVEGFAAEQVVKMLAAHGINARVRIRGGTTAEVLLDSPDGVEIQLQDVNDCGGGGPVGNRCV